MKRFFLFVALSAIAAATASVASAQVFTNTATQDVTIDVKAINRLAIGGVPVTLTISEGTPGSTTLAQATHNTSHYSITSNKPNQKLTAQITDGTLDAGLNLFLSAVAPSGRGTATAEADISNKNPYDVVTAIPKGATSNQTITYRLTATTDVEPYTAPKVIQVTWTLQDN